MKRNKIQFWYGLIGLLISGVILYLIYSVVIVVLSKISVIDANILVAFIAGSVTIIGYFITRFLEKRKLIEQQIREQKIPVYEEFINFFFKLFRKTKGQEEIAPKEFEDFFWEMNKKSVLWLSDKTFKSYIEWKNTTTKYADLESKSQADGIKMLMLFEKLLLDFREDIGHKNKEIEKGDLLSLFINDWEEFKNTRSI